MEYMTVAQAVIKWGVSERWIQRLVQDGRIEGAKRFGRDWAIPADAEKPTDNRIKDGQYRNWRKKPQPANKEVNPDE